MDNQDEQNAEVVETPVEEGEQNEEPKEVEALDATADDEAEPTGDDGTEPTADTENNEAETGDNAAETGDNAAETVEMQKQPSEESVAEVETIKEPEMPRLLGPSIPHPQQSTDSDSMSSESDNKEYKEILLQLHSANHIIDEIKRKIQEKCCKSPRTTCETREIRSLKMCLEKENLKQKCLMKRLTCIRDKDPKHQWGQVQLSSPLEWDNMPLQFNLDYIPKFCPATKSDKCKSKKTNRRSKELDQSYCLQEKLVSDNSDLECERYKLQEELLARDKKIECLQHKVQLIQCDLMKLCREKQNAKHKPHNSSENTKCPTIEKRFNSCKENRKSLESGIDEMQNTIKRLNLELCHLKNDRSSFTSQTQPDIEQVCASFRKKKDVCIDRNEKTRDGEIRELKENYTNLLSDYGRKENELKMLQERVKGICEERKNGNNLENLEIDLLREKIRDYQEEQDEYKCLIKEQSEQLEDYRQKYLTAQQKVEEQKCMLEKMDMNNKRIEDQVNLEIQRIKSKFQEKLKELAYLPKLLENEQIKLANITKEKEDLQNKLCIVCRELKAIKLQMNPGDESAHIDWEERCKKAENELKQIQSVYDDLLKNKNLLCQQFQKTKCELDCLRTESARIITRTKERSENQRELLQTHIDKLERDLAQCRATASLSIADREDVIKEMKGQLNCLSSSFDSAQMQIKTLKDHISYISNDNHVPAVMANC